MNLNGGDWILIGAGFFLFGIWIFANFIHGPHGVVIDESLQIDDRLQERVTPEQNRGRMMKTTMEDLAIEIQFARDSLTQLSIELAILQSAFNTTGNSMIAGKLQNMVEKVDITEESLGKTYSKYLFNEILESQDQVDRAFSRVIKWGFYETQSEEKKI